MFTAYLTSVVLKIFLDYQKFSESLLIQFQAWVSSAIKWRCHISVIISCTSFTKIIKEKFHFTYDLLLIFYINYKKKIFPL